jgi:hypothetical protein
MTSLFRLIIATIVLTGCSTLTVEEAAQKRDELDSMAERAVAALIEKEPGLRQQIDSSKGYLVADMKLTKVPIVGAGGGEGVFIDKVNNERKFIEVGRFDIGGGWGARAYKALLVIETDEVLQRLNSGVWEFAAGVEASAGSAAADGSSSGLKQGYTLHVLSEAGASATATARVIRIKLNTKLNSD